MTATDAMVIAGAGVMVTGAMATAMAIVAATMAMVGVIAGAVATKAGNMAPTRTPLSAAPMGKAGAGAVMAAGTKAGANVGVAGRAMAATRFPRLLR
jgi:hypothetical protein